MVPHDFPKKMSLVVVFSILCNVFFYRMFWSTGFAIFALFNFLLLSTLYLPEIKKHRLYSVVGVSGGILILFTYLSVSSGNDGILFLSALSSVVILGMYLYLLVGSVPMYSGMFEFLLSPFVLFVHYITSAIEYIVALVDPKNHTLFSSQLRASGKLRPLFVGIFLSLPLLWIVNGLLMQADPVFKSFINKIFFIKLNEELVGRVVLTAILFCLYTPMSVLYISHRLTRAHMVYRINASKEMMIILGSLSALLALFLVVQWPYVFASVPFETDLSRFGVATYSEYVRKGFGELLVITCIAYGVLWISRVARLGQATQKEKRFVSIMFTFLFFLIIIFIISIARRVYLYQIYHGWTVIRLYGLWMVTWITVLLVTLMARSVSNRRWIGFELTTSFLLVFGLGVFNVERFVVHTHPPTVNNRVDYVYLSRLSPDGYDGWVKAYSFAQAVLNTGDLLTKSVISKDERRDVFYTAQIIERLLRRYHELVVYYGTAQEQREYIHAVSAIIVSAEQDYIVRLKQSPVGANGQNTINIRITEKQKDIAALYDMLAKFDRGELSVYKFAQYVFVSNDFCYPTGVDTCFTERDVLYDEKSFYRYNSELFAGRERLTLLDRIYTFSLSRSRAYQKIKSDMPMTSLLGLQEKYFLVSDRIRRQPADERTFESDISFDAPFVED